MAPRAQGRRVVVAMSGGADSSVAAALLREALDEVLGVTLQLHEPHESSASPATRAREVAVKLGIPHHVLDCARAFEREVLRPAWDEYAAGRTPSPCLLCNERIKLGLLYDWARELGATHLATGHYVRSARSAAGETILLRGRDLVKDQSYFLAGLDKERLASLVFPLGDLKKTEVRALGRSFGLPSAEARDSQDACLSSPGQSFAEVLRARFEATAHPGDFVDESGAVLGRHPGIHRFTIGQRKGLGISSTHRLFVKELCAKDRVVVLTDDEEALSSERFSASKVSWLASPPPIGGVLACEVQVRYRQGAIRASVVCGADDKVFVTLEEPVRAITPGQAAVFYDGSRVLGRGWID